MTEEEFKKLKDCVRVLVEALYYGSEDINVPWVQESLRTCLKVLHDE